MRILLSLSLLAACSPAAAHVTTECAYDNQLMRYQVVRIERVDGLITAFRRRAGAGTAKIHQFAPTGDPPIRVIGRTVLEIPQGGAAASI